jgi:hypothetical protein
LADPIFWLALSLFCVAVSFTTVLLVAVPAFRELSRMARSAERLLDTLDRELPPTLDTLRRTGGEVADLTDELQQGVQSASRIVEQVDQSLSSTRQQMETLHYGSRSLWAGIRVAWGVWTQPTKRRPKPKKLSHRRSALAETRPTPSSRQRPDSPAERIQSSQSLNNDD